MKKLLISITMVSLFATTQAKPFSMADYQAQTGKTPQKVEVKKEVSIHAVIQTIESNTDKAKIKLEKLALTKSLAVKSFADRSAKIGALKGDTSNMRMSLNTSRKTKMAGFAREELALRKVIKDNVEKIKYYKMVAQVEKMGRSLVARDIIKSRASV